MGPRSGCAIAIGTIRAGRTTSQAVGYREVLDYLAGHLDSEAMVEKIKSRTRRFAKRQRTWFRSLSECRFEDIAGEVDSEEVAARIRAEGRKVKNGDSHLFHTRI